MVRSRCTCGDSQRIVEGYCAIYLLSKHVHGPKGFLEMLHDAETKWYWCRLCHKECTQVSHVESAGHKAKLDVWWQRIANGEEPWKLLAAGGMNAPHWVSNSSTKRLVEDSDSEEELPVQKGKGKPDVQKGNGKGNRSYQEELTRCAERQWQRKQQEVIQDAMKQELEERVLMLPRQLATISMANADLHQRLEALEAQRLPFQLLGKGSSWYGGPPGMAAPLWSTGVWGSTSRSKGETWQASAAAGQNDPWTSETWQVSAALQASEEPG